MDVLGPITLDELHTRLDEILDGVVENGELWEVRLVEGEEGFVVGPVDVCGQVMGLVDEEYGWPAPVQVDQDVAASALAPRRRHHPVYLRNGKPVAIAISMGELDLIRERSRDVGEDTKIHE